MAFMVIDLNYYGPNYPIVIRNNISHLYNNYKRLMFIVSQLWLLKIAFMYYTVVGFRRNEKVIIIYKYLENTF